MADHRKIGIVANPFKKDAKSYVADVRGALEARGLAVVIESKTAELCGIDAESFPLDKVGEHVDLVVVLGGDGTILHVVSAAGASIRPLAALNMGRLGFLTCATSAEKDAFIERLTGRDYWLSCRSTIEVEFARQDGVTAKVTGLNEAVISRGGTARMIQLEARINGQHINRYGGDGLIVATPTGSTAYSLSAGGPIISPESQVFVVTPICAHALSNRAVVLNDAVEIEIVPDDGQEELILSVDGRSTCHLAPDKSVKMRRGSYDVPLVMMGDSRFYGVLQDKLGWRGSIV